MKRFILVLVVLAVALLAQPSWAQSDMKMAKEMIADELRQNTFDRLVSVQTVVLNTTASINFVGSAATGTTAITVPSALPFMLKIHNHNVGSLTYTLFAANAVGVTQPTATSPHLLDPFGAPVVSGKAYKQIFHAAPNLSIGASGATEVQVEIWGRANE
jgi:hypothetical protein